MMGRAGLSLWVGVSQERGAGESVMVAKYRVQTDIISLCRVLSLSLDIQKLFRRAKVVKAQGEELGRQRSYRSKDQDEQRSGRAKKGSWWYSDMHYSRQPL